MRGPYSYNFENFAKIQIFLQFTLPSVKVIIVFFFSYRQKFTTKAGENINSNTFKHSFLENGLEVLLVKFDIITLSWVKVNNSIPFSLINYETHCTAWLSNGKRL